MNQLSNGVYLRPCGKVLVFVKDGKDIGELDWSLERFEFFGDMGESADTFFKILMMWSNQLPKQPLEESMGDFFKGVEE
jgi:hypothetical protein